MVAGGIFPMDLFDLSEWIYFSRFIFHVIYQTAK